ncbi:MAG: 4Fe-4S binding protein [Candidatus Omnitrophica bacterium]|nr:4Fe-4S binding protein [Candidatus Omnitrophota bacterium]
MPKRKIIKIDTDKCTGCAECIPDCPEGAIQLIDGKARLISDLFCDGLGACIGSCPVDAIKIEEREAEKYDEKKVMENIIKGGKNTIKAHLKHLDDHNQKEYLQQAREVLKEKNIEISQYQAKQESKEQPAEEEKAKTESFDLGQWPIQLKLVSPLAPYFHKKDIVIAADCVGYAVGDFRKYIQDKSLVIACPKLDSAKQQYVQKIKALADIAEINTLTVMIMQVPCCSGLVMLAQQALEEAKRKVPLKKMVVSIKGKIISEEWV